MRAAFSLARRGLGRVAPNPAVGCVLVKEGKALARGWTQPGGRPHAETEALARAGTGAHGATAYVTLEPCSHTGQTGPCADALIAARISRAVVALVDPDQRVSGRGIARLREAGITVDTGILEAEARDLNLGFILSRTEGRPLVMLKLATSLDGRIATASGESKWITGPEARADAHLLRMTQDAILVGIGTALADNPALTCRLPGVEPGRLRVVLDRQGRLPADTALCDGTAPTVQIVGPDCSTPIPVGIERLEVPLDAKGLLSIPDVLSRLGAKGVTRLMVEGGGQVAASFLKAGLVDRIVWYRAGIALGGDARSGIGMLGIDSLATVSHFKFVRSHCLGSDRVDHLVRDI